MPCGQAGRKWGSANVTWTWPGKACKVHPACILGCPSVATDLNKPFSVPVSVRCEMLERTTLQCIHEQVARSPLQVNTSQSNTTGL